MTIWHDIIQHYADNPEKQKQTYQEFEREIRAVLLPPSWLY
jgi:hypothetical protein